jgi:2-desacetyl-2-hydroxyethyl bacteriochlorophyllide A dehydrogenase
VTSTTSVKVFLASKENQRALAVQGQEGDSNMRQAVMIQPGTIEYRDIPEPEAGPGEVLLRIQRIGVCGSDVHVNHGKHPFTSYPVVQGHEFSAVVEAVGEGVANIDVGSKATATPQIVCGECGPCRRGDYHICDHLKVQGFQAPGVAQDLFVTPAEKLVPLPASFSHEQGALVEPVSVAVRATRRAGDMNGKNVAVLGAGPIGNLTAQMSRARGAKVLITDLSDFRLEIARECGIEAVSNPGSESLSDASKRVFRGVGFDIAFDCAGAQETIDAAVDAVNKGGTIVAVAVYEDKPRVDMAVVGDRELTIVGTLMYQYGDYDEAVRRIASGDISTGPLDSKHFLFEQYASAYEFIDQQGVNSMKVFIDL